MYSVIIYLKINDRRKSPEGHWYCRRIMLL